MPDRIIRYLEIAEKMARSASHTLDCIKKLTAIGLMIVIGIGVISACNASTGHSNQGTEREAAVKNLAKQMDLLAARSERIDALIIQWFETRMGDGE